MPVNRIWADMVSSTFTVKEPISSAGSPHVYEYHISQGELKPLLWWESAKVNNYTVGAKTICGTYYIDIDGGAYTAMLEYYDDGIQQWVGPVRDNIWAAKEDARNHYYNLIMDCFQ